MAGEASGEEFTLPVAELPDRRAARQLAAMRLLFDTKREHQVNDVLLATIFEHLAAGSRTTDELGRAVEADWPGVTVSREFLERALLEATDQGFLSHSPNLSSTGAWAVADKAE